MTTTPEKSQAKNSPLKPGTGRSFALIALGRFKRNRLAVAAFIVVWLMVTMAVFVPFLANNKPYVIKASLENKFDNSYFVILSAGDTYMAMKRGGGDISEGEREEKLTTARKQMLFHLRVMARQLGLDDAARLKEFENKLKAQLKTYDEAAFEGLFLDFEDSFDVENLTLVPRFHYPLVREFSWVQIFFVCLYFFMMAYFLTLHFLHVRTPRIFRAGAIMIVLALCCGGVWRYLFPPVHDTLSYKSLVEEQSDTFAIFPPIPYGENENITGDARQAPVWLLSAEERSAASGTHWLGTDMNGRDVMSRMIHGSRIAMTIGIVAVGIYLTIGIIMGALAGYYRGWIDIAISRLIEVVLCFPSFFLIITVLAFLRPSIFNIMIVIGLTGWTGVARLVRGEFLRVVNEEYVQAIRTLGGSDFRVIFRHVLPNGMGPVLVSASFGLAAAILVESTLSFLGFGVPQPKASWGTILFDGRNDIMGAWWLTVFPGIAIFITVMALNLVGEGVRDATDPRFFVD